MSNIGQIKKQEFSYDVFLELIEEVCYISRYWAKMDESHLPPSNDNLPFATKLSHLVWYKEFSMPVYSVKNPEEKLGDFSLTSTKKALESMARQFPDSYKNIVIEADFDFFDADVFFQLAVKNKVNTNL
jgi:hypothetical protein